MLHKIPIDILLEIVKHVSFADITRIMNTNSRLYKHINNNLHYIVNQELKQFDKPIHLSEMHQTLSSFFCSKYLKATFGLNMNNIDKISAITSSSYVNRLFKKIMIVFITDKSLYNVRSFDLFFMYQMINMFVRRNLKNVNYNVNFLAKFGSNITFDYFTRVIENEYVNVSIDSLHTISKYMVNIPLICKLFPSRLLQLDNTVYKQCCYSCYKRNLQRLVQYKYNRYNDHLININYSTLKQFLKENDKTQYRLIESYENSIVNKHIFIENPVTYKLVPITSKEAILLLRNLKLQKNNTRIQRHIMKERKVLRRKFFDL